MSDTAAIEEKLLILKQRYISALKEKISHINDLWHDSVLKKRISDKQLESALHKLAGSAGMHQEHELGALARKIELLVADNNGDLTPEFIRDLNNELDKLRIKISELSS